MIKESQEKYLSTLSDNRVIVIKPFDPKVRETANEIVQQLQNILPELKKDA